MNRRHGYWDSEPPLSRKPLSPAPSVDEPEEPEVYAEEIEPEDEMVEEPVAHEPRRTPLRLMLLGAVALLGLGGLAGYLLLETPDRTAAVATAGAQPPASQAPAAPIPPPSVPAAAPPTPAVSEQTVSAGANPAATQNLRTEKIEDWFLVCPAEAPTNEQCEVQQRLRSAETRAVVLIWSIRRDADGVLRAVWQTPAGLTREAGMVIDVGDGKPSTVPFSNCTDKLCTAQAVIAPPYLQTLRDAANISAIVVPVSTGTPVRFGLSSKGLIDALARLDARP